MPMTITPPDPPPSAQPKRLIVVDDDKLFLSVFAANLQVGGYLPVCFDDSQAALAALTADTQARACVLDLDMPGLDGLGSCMVTRWRDLFNVGFDVLLYDLTSTYFGINAADVPEVDKPATATAVTSARTVRTW
jgi:ActR/RegA family two-component response regulator